MNKQAEQHLGRAEGFLARGEEFYRKAASEIIAAMEADPTLGQREVGERFGRSQKWVSELVRWSTSEQGTATPWSEEKGAVAQRHTKSVLRNAPVEQVEKIVAELPTERLDEIAETVVRQQVERKLYPDKRRPDHAEATERQRAEEVGRRKKNPTEAYIRLGAKIGTWRAHVRVVVAEYQDFRALVTDQEILEAGRDDMNDLRASIDLALSEAIDGSFEEAFSRLTTEEEGVK